MTDVNITQHLVLLENFRDFTCVEASYVLERIIEVLGLSEGDDLGQPLGSTTFFYCRQFDKPPKLVGKMDITPHCLCIVREP